MRIFANVIIILLVLVSFCSCDGNRRQGAKSPSVVTSAEPDTTDLYQDSEGEILYEKGDTSAHVRPVNRCRDEDYEPADGKVHTIDELKNSVWLDMDENRKYSIERTIFTDSVRYVLSCSVNSGNRYCNASRYYLSDSMERRFDYSRYGKSRKGKYIVLEDIYKGDTTVVHALILSISKNSLVYYWMPDRRAIGARYMNKHFKRIGSSKEVLDSIRRAGVTP